MDTAVLGYQVRGGMSASKSEWIRRARRLALGEQIGDNGANFPESFRRRHGFPRF